MSLNSDYNDQGLSRNINSSSFSLSHNTLHRRVSSILPETKLVLLTRDPVERYESARRMYMCFQKKVQMRGEQFHEEHNMAAYLAAAIAGSKVFMPLQRGLYMVS